MSLNRIALSCLLAIVLLASSGTAVAVANGPSSGDQQYCDPLSGCGSGSSGGGSGSGTHTTKGSSGSGAAALVGAGIGVALLGTGVIVWRRTRKT